MATPNFISNFNSLLLKQPIDKVWQTLTAGQFYFRGMTLSLFFQCHPPLFPTPNPPIIPHPQSSHYSPPPILALFSTPNPPIIPHPQSSHYSPPQSSIIPHPHHHRRRRHYEFTS